MLSHLSAMGAGMGVSVVAAGILLVASRAAHGGSADTVHHPDLRSIIPPQELIIHRDESGAKLLH